MRSLPLPRVRRCIGLPAAITVTLACATAQELRPAPPLITSGSLFAMGDVDGSGAVDFVATGASGVLLLLDPGLHGAATVSVISPPVALAAVSGPRLVDVEGDGLLDLLLPVTHPVGWALQKQRGLGGGTFAAPTILATFPIAFTSQFAAGDFDGNGELDFVCQSGANANFPTLDLLMQYQGAFVRTALTPGNRIAIGDFDGDGIDDLAAGTNTVAVYRGSAAGLLFVGTQVIPAGVQLAEICDADADGRDDILWYGFGTLAMHWGDATAVLNPTLTNLPSPFAPSTAAAADVDADGVVDIVLSSLTATMMRGRGGRALSTARSLYAARLDGFFVDLDGDGDLDHVLRSGERLENFAHYGASCGAPMHLAAPTIVPGTAWQLQITGAPANTLAAILFAGADQPATCGTLVDPATLLGNLPLLFTDAQGAASLAIPLLPNFVGGPYYLQALALDPSGGYQRYGVTLSSSQGRAVRLF